MMHRQPIAIFGAGGLGGEIKALIDRLPGWNATGFYDDAIAPETLVHGLPCRGGLSDLLQTSTPTAVVLAIGDPARKMQLAEQLSTHQFVTFPVLVDPAAILLDPASIVLSPGSLVTAGCVLTRAISIGAHTLVNLNVTLGHDVAIGTCCSIMPGANLAGSVILGEGVLVGSGANLINQVRVGDCARVGAGAVVTRDVQAGKTVTGVPAREH